MKLIKNFTTANTHVEDETLIGIPLERLLIFAAGCEQRTLGNVDVAAFNPSAGRIDFLYPLGNVQCIVLAIN